MVPLVSVSSFCACLLSVGISVKKLGETQSEDLEEEEKTKK